MTLLLISKKSGDGGSKAAQPATLTKLQAMVDHQALRNRQLEGAIARLGKRVDELEKLCAGLARADVILEQTHAAHVHSVERETGPPFGFITKKGFDAIDGDALVPYVSRLNADFHAKDDTVTMDETTPPTPGTA